MPSSFENCIARNRLKPIEPDPEKMAIELGKAMEELERARSGYLARKYRDSVTQSYFAMLRCARAGLNARGYRDTNLYGLCVGLDELWVKTEDLQKSAIDHLRKAKDVKDSAYNGYPISPDQAKLLLTWAQTMSREILVRLALPGFEGDTIQTDIPAQLSPDQKYQDDVGEETERNYNTEEFNKSRHERNSQSNYRPKHGNYGRDNRDRYNR